MFYSKNCLRFKFISPILNCGEKKCYSSKTSKGIDMAYDKYGKLPLIIMHCLFGSKTNWISLSKELNKSLNRTVYAVDLRNHGDSPHTETFNYDLLNEDINKFLEKLSLTKVSIMGHSVGGKAALYYAMKHPDSVEKVVAIDISPFSKSTARGNLYSLFGLMKSIQIDPSVSSGNGRKMARQFLMKHTQNKLLVDFLLMNFIKSPEGPFKWRFNLESLEKDFFEHIIAFPDMREKVEKAVLFIVGLHSDYLKPEDEEKILELFPNSKFVYLNTGHLVHAEDPADVIKEVTIFLNH